MEGFETRPAARINKVSRSRYDDFVVSEEALSILVNSDVHGEQKLGVTMRTKGHDTNLVLGFLFSEGIINSVDEVLGVENESDKTKISLSSESNFDPSLHCRPSIVSSACGICGRSTIDDALHMHSPDLDETIKISLSSISKSLETMVSKQTLFTRTGGSHACASIDINGDIKRIFEDVGRHNAMDKLVGSYVAERQVPVNRLISFVSGRASFELVQKSIRAGFSIMVAIGAPSSLAIDLAKEHGLTLVCFARNESITVYTGIRRVNDQATTS